jgi:hypothetical protein
MAHTKVQTEPDRRPLGKPLSSGGGNGTTFPVDDGPEEDVGWATGASMPVWMILRSGEAGVMSCNSEHSQG